eukprot:3991725-Alexandrium_andersonii.AAC.1
MFANFGSSGRTSLQKLSGSEPNVTENKDVWCSNKDSTSSKGFTMETGPGVMDLSLALSGTVKLIGVGTVIPEQKALKRSLVAFP